MRKSLLILLLALGACALQAQNTPPTPAPDESTGMWFYGLMSSISYEEMIRHTADAQKIRFLYDPGKVKGEVTIACPKEGVFIPYTAFFSVLQTFLKQAKMILSPFGEDTTQSVRFYEIIPAIEAISQSPTVLLLDNLDNWTDMTADFVTLVVNLKYAEANSVRGALQNLVSRNGGQVNPIPGINSLIIADYSYNIRRLAMIIKMMDQPPRSPRLEVINVNYLDAEELVTSLTNLLNQRQQLLQTAPRRPGSPDDETLVRVEVAPYVNAIMVTGYDAGIELVRELVKKLDVQIPGATTQGKIHYYQCKNKLASDLATVLNDVLGSGVPTNQPIVPAQPGVVGSANVPTIVAHESTNSLIVIATAADYNEVLKIIEKIDTRSPQVLIEAAILEVRDDDDFQFGVEIATVDGFANTSKDPRLSFGTSFGFSEVVDASGVPISTAGGIPAGRNPIIGTGGLLTLNKGTAFDIPLLVRFLKTQTDANVLQQPYLLTNDNQAATFEVNTEIQLIEINQNINGNIAGAGQFVEAGITMEVTPQISYDGYVTLQVVLDITNFIGESATPGVSPPRQQRRVDTFVTVPDSTTAIIGGLKSSESGKTVSKIPLLGDIPLLGELFKSQRTVERKTNLYIFLRPKIMKDVNFGELKAESQRRLDSARKDSEKSMTEQKDEFFKRSQEDLKRQRTSRPGTQKRAFDYQGLPETK